MKNNPNKKENIVDNLHGIKVADLYRWLENASDPTVQDWIAIQNDRAEKSLKQNLKNDLFETFTYELEKNFKYVNYGSPVPMQGKYFYMERQPDEDQLAVYVKKGIEGTPITIFNPNGKKGRKYRDC